MNSIAISLVLLLFQAGAVPQNQGRQQQQQTRPQDRASVTGFILKMGTGEPVSKAVVTISLFNGGRAQSYTATTAVGGQFTFQNSSRDSIAFPQRAAATSAWNMERAARTGPGYRSASIQAKS